MTPLLKTFKLTAETADKRVRSLTERRQEDPRHTVSNEELAEIIAMSNHVVATTQMALCHSLNQIAARLDAVEAK